MIWLPSSSSTSTTAHIRSLCCTSWCIYRLGASGISGPLRGVPENVSNASAMLTQRVNSSYRRRRSAINRVGCVIVLHGGGSRKVRGRNLPNVIYYLSNTKIVRASERIRFGATAAMATSVASVWSVRDRSASPITRSYRPIDVSTLATQRANTIKVPPLASAARAAPGQDHACHAKADRVVSRHPRRNRVHRPVRRPIPPPRRRRSPQGKNRRCWAAPHGTPYMTHCPSRGANGGGPGLIKRLSVWFAGGHAEASP